MRKIGALGLTLMLFAGSAFATESAKVPTCDQFPSGLERIAKAPSIAEIDDVMIDFGWAFKIGEEGLQKYFGGVLEEARASASENMSRKQTIVCGK